MAKNTYKIVFFSVLTLMLGLSCNKNENGKGPDPQPVGDVVLHTVWDMNKEAAVLNSHVGDEMTSTLNPIYECYSVIPNAKLIGSNPGENWACYPRIKQMADGRFIMFYHRSQYGYKVWCVTSDDLITWSAPTTLYEPVSVKITYPDGKSDNETLHYVNPDAVVLGDGTLLMVCSYRPVGGSLNRGGYNYGLNCGLSFRISKDNAKTWGQPVNVEVGANWEPYLLLLPDGTIQCYYTDAIPQTRNSGTAMIVSKDGGKTWSGKKRVCQQYKYQYYTPGSTDKTKEKKQYNGQYIYTDQMPCFRILNDGKTIAGWLEARLERPTPSDCANSDTYSSSCMMSLVRNHSLDWEDLGSDGSYKTIKIEGPQDRESNVMKGAGGYIVTFPSGEVAMSCGLNSLMSIKMGNVSATRFRGYPNWVDCLIRPFEGKGYWSCMEAFNQNYVAIAMHWKTEAEGNMGMQTGALYLNHRLDAEQASITVDGDVAEWKTTRAFYLSVPSKEDVIIRTCHDAQNLYLAAECRDEALSAGTSLSVVLASDAVSGNVILNSKGLVSSGFTGTNAVAKQAKTPSGQKGWVCEVAIPLSSLGAGVGDVLKCYAEFEAGGSKSVFTLSKTSKEDPNKTTWQLIKIK